MPDILESDDRSRRERAYLERAAKDRLDLMIRMTESHALDLCACNACWKLREFASGRKP